VGELFVPRYPYNRLGLWVPPEANDEHRDDLLRKELLRLHDVAPGPRLERLQRLAHIILAWADSRFPADYSPALLAAGSVSPGRLKRMLNRMVDAMLALAPPLPRGLHSERIKTMEQDNPILIVSRLLNGLMAVRAIIAMEDDGEIFGGVEEREGDGVIDPFTKAYIRYATPETGASIRRALKHLRSEMGKRSASADAKAKEANGAEAICHRDAISVRAWHHTLEEAMRLAVGKLKTVVRRNRFDGGANGTSATQRRFVAAVNALDTMARRRRGYTAGQWMKAASRLQADADEWIKKEMQNHVTGSRRESKKISLARSLAFVQQYAALMVGSRSISTAVTPLWYVRDICAALVNVGVGEEKGKKEPQRAARSREEMRKILAYYDSRVVDAGLLEIWRKILGENAVTLGQFIADVTMPKDPRVAQTVRWAQGERFLYFTGLWPSAENNNDESLKDVFVNKCLTPLQRVGLAAQIPDDVWQRARELEANARDRDPGQKGKPLARYYSKKWIVNPLGAMLAEPPDRRRA
jgi:hypothetical protein